jgi:rSAM/selenodomain-associated transferase 2/rSAM/selenodomain-associated transferase 1
VTRADAPALSVIVPTLDEAGHLPRLLRELEALGPDMEVLVVDGGSTDGTATRARAGGATVLRRPPGRGGQLRAGGSAARAPWLLFLHADTRFPAAAARAVRSFTATASPERAAYFPFALDAPSPGWRLLEAGQRLRERLTGLVYGDQGLLVSRRLYEEVGGHPPWPLMEDVAVVDRIRAAGRLERLQVPLPTSPRRYRREGRVRASLRNTLLVSLFRLGVPPERLLRWYGSEGRRADEVPEAGGSSGRWSRGREEEAAGPTRGSDRGAILLVFAKAPREGDVKTRLAAEVGDREATRIYRALGRRVVEAVRGGAWRTRICFTPTEARGELEAWLGTDRLQFRPQADGDLGRRMSAAFEDAFAEGATRVCVVGTDVDGLEESLVARAFSALEGHDVVLGPAHDGGYWLLGLTRPRPALFERIRWSTARVLDETLERARALGLRVHLLPTLRDVDHQSDVPPGLLRT